MYEMYTAEGNSAIANMIIDLTQIMKTEPLSKVKQSLHQKMNAILRSHGEVYDTEPRYLIANMLSVRAKKLHGIELEIDYWGLH